MIKASELQKFIGRQVKYYRKAANLSQEQLAEKIGIATNSLSNIETGNSFMTIYTLEKIINVLKISPKQLFDFPEILSEDEDKMGYILKSLKIIERDKNKLALLYMFVSLLV